MPPTYLVTLRQAAQRALDDGSAYAVGTATSTTVTVPALVNATPNASAALYNGAWVYVASGAAAGQQRKVKTDGYTPSTGALAIYPPWTTTPVGAEILEITHLFPSSGFPPVSGVSGEDTSHRSLLNRACGLLAKPAEIAIPITTGRTYSLAAYPYLDREARLVRVLEPDPVDGLPVECPWRGWELRLNAAVPLLQVTAPFLTATGSLTLEVMRPVRDWVETSGTFATSTAGLVNDTDRVDVDEEDVLPVFLMLAYEALAARSPGRPFPGAADQAKFWRGVAMQGRYWDRTQSAPQQTAAPPESGRAA